MKRKASAGNDMEIILASGSSRRKEILSDLGYTFTVQPANGEEVLELENGIDQAIELIAYRKAKEVQKLYPNACVIGADTVVCFENENLPRQGWFVWDPRMRFCRKDRWFVFKCGWASKR